MTERPGNQLGQRFDDLVQEASELAGQYGVAPEEVTHCAKAIEALLAAMEFNPTPVSTAHLEATSYGRYQVEKQLSTGDMGAILQAWDPKLKRALAIKVMLSETASERSQQRFLYEGRITSQLQHPNIVPVHDIGQTPDGRQYICMKLVPGCTLAERLTQIEDPQAALPGLLRNFLKICDGMELAHARGVIHRDLKPANIMIGEFGEVLIMDWGVARDPGQPATETEPDDPGTDPLATLDGEILGTPAFMSPEQARGEIDRIDHRSDIYGLGAILYAMLTGGPPYQGNPQEVLVQVSLAGMKVPSRQAPGRVVPRELDSVVIHAMAADPDDRYPSVAALRSEIEAYLTDRKLAAAQYNAWQVLRKWLARHRAVSLVCAAALLLIIIITTVFMLRLSTRRKQAEQAAQSERALRVQIEQEARRDREVTLLRRLEDQARNQLWPTLPEKLPALRSWRKRAETLREKDLRKRLALVTASIEKRIRTAERIALLSRGRDWADCGIPPQAGLVPLGRDPASKLAEFAHLLSGQIPNRRRDGTLELTNRSAVVLVLIPRGTLQMGASRSGLEPDAQARPDEGPVHPVPIEAYLIGKHELTVGQWRRITGEARAGDDRLPVSLVSWSAARNALRRVGLDLPSEAQWEWAARGGSRTTWWTGANPLRLTAAANLADQALHRTDRSAPHELWLDDGYAKTAPVGQFRANGYGLHDVVGNVREWCLDRPLNYDGKLDPTAQWYRVQRDASYAELAIEGRSARRHRAAPQSASPQTGLRPAHPVSR